MSALFNILRFRKMKTITHCFHAIFFLLWALVHTSMAAESVTISPFSTDGCSLFPDGTLKNKTLWQACCIEHDKAYWQGGTYKERKTADEALGKCVASVGQLKTAKLMQQGVRVGGSPYWPTPFRWGYGWSYIRGYKALTISELVAIETMAYSLEPAFYQHDNASETKSAPTLTQALKLVDNFSQYQIVLVSMEKGQEYCDIVGAYTEKNDLIIKFKYRGESKLTLSGFDEKNAFAGGSYPIIFPVIGTSHVDVQLKFNADGTANGYWANLGFEDEFKIIKKKHKHVLTEIFAQWFENVSQYQIALVSLDKGQEYCDILDIRREKKGIAIKFRYRGETKLTFTEFDEENTIMIGSYPISLPILGNSTVHVELKVNADGSANGYWVNLGFEDKFNIVKK